MQIMRYIFTFIIFILSVQITSAQGFREVAIQLEPEYPKPASSVQVSLQSYSQNLQGSKIGWYLDDVLIKEGDGLTSLELTVPILGEQINLIIKINNIVVASRTIIPTTIDILWEAQTYTPKHYKGRALPVDSSIVRAIALPHFGRDINPQDLIYNWYKGSRFLTRQSGRGKNTLITDSPGLYDDYNLIVEVTDTQGRVLGQNGVRITATEPELIFYNTSPLLGTIFQSALSANIAQQQKVERSLIAIPYYFSITTERELSYTWRISGAQYIQEGAPNNITITNTDTRANISVGAQHQQSLLQSASTSYRFLGQNTLFNTYQQQDYVSPFGNPNN